jgi:hypothetical protein
MPTGEDLTSIIEAMIEVTEELQLALGVQNEIRREELRRLRTGEPPRDIVSTLPVGATRMRSKVAQEEMEAQRKTLRLALMGRCIDEGLTNKDIARIWGVSVQLVSRYTAPEHMPG